MPVEIRRLTEPEIPAFRECLDVVARERCHLAMLEAPPIERLQAYLGDLIKKGAPAFVAVDDGKIVGWCDISPNSREVFKHRGDLGMGLLPGHRGKGFGRRLLQAALDAARTYGLERVDLQVYPSNTAAVRLYEKTGFIVEGTLQKARKLDGVYQDILVMALFLK